MKRLSLILIVLLQLFAAKAQINISVSPDTIRFATPFEFTVSVKAPRNATVAMGEPQKAFGQNIGLHDIVIDTAYEQDTKTVNYKFVLLPFDDSLAIIKPLKIQIDSSVFVTDTIVLPVNRLIVDTALIKQIDTTLTLPVIDTAEPMAAPFTLKEFWLRYRNLLFALLILVLLGFALYWYLKRKKENKPVLAPAKPQIAPYEEALNLLKALKEKKLCTQGRTKEFYSDLSYIVRQYIEKQFSISALELTTSELRTVLKYANVLDSQLYKKLMTLFRNADLVKFAKYNPALAVCDHDLQTAFEVVEQTMPQQDENDDENDSSPEQNTEKQ